MSWGCAAAAFTGRFPGSLSQLCPVRISAVRSSRAREEQRNHKRELDMLFTSLDDQMQWWNLSASWACPPSCPRANLDDDHMQW